MAQRHVLLSESERQELARLRDTADKPYLRERAAAILKVADGTPAAVVARTGLLRQRKPDTIYDWLNRFHQEGIEGLSIRPGRGRKRTSDDTSPIDSPRNGYHTANGHHVEALPSREAQYHEIGRAS